MWPHSEKLGNCSPYFTALQYINNLETQRSPKTTLDLENTILKKNLLSGLKIIRLFVKVERNVYKSHPPANKSASIHANQIVRSSNRLELSP